jgi:hypothetical protein
LGFAQLGGAMGFQRAAALIGLDRRIEVELATLQLLHDPLQLAQRLLEAHLRDDRLLLGSLGRRGCIPVGGVFAHIPSRLGSGAAQRIQMGQAAVGKSPQVIAAFEHRDQTTFGVARGATL